MKPWIHDFVKNSTVGELTIIEASGQPITVSMRSYFSNGLIFLQPAIEFGGLPVKIKDKQRGSLFLGEISSTNNKNVLLQGHVEVIPSSDYLAITSKVSNQQIAIKFKASKVFAKDKNAGESSFDEYNLELVL